MKPISQSDTFSALVNRVTALEAVTPGTFADGMLSLPAFRFTLDPDTGFYRSANDTLSAVTGGVERVQIGAGGNVGIGMVAAGYRLDVAGDARLSASSYYHSTTAGGASVRMLGINSGGTAYVGPIDPGPTSMALNASSTSTLIDLYTGGSVRARLDSAGYLGIGTTSPQQRLHVVGNIRQQNVTDGNDGYQLYNAAGQNSGSIYCAGTAYFAFQANQSRLDLTSITERIRFLTANTERMVLETTGRLTLSGPVKPGSFTVATLPSASAMGDGSIARCTDATATTPRSVVAGGGANKVLVISDGTNWLIGV